MLNLKYTSKKEIRSTPKFLDKKNTNYSIIKNIHLLIQPSIPVYLKARNEINDRRLRWLEELSNTLPLPKLFGEFSSNQHYLDTVDLFINATLETRHRGLFFLKKIIPELSKKQSFLDIGPGKGKLTNWIGRKFKMVTVVDHCPAALENIREVNFNGASLRKIHNEFINTEFFLQKFDLINMSHMIYYINKDQLIQNIKKAYDLLMPHGVLVIVFNEGLNREQLAQDFGGNPQSFESFLKLFSFMYNIHVKIHVSKESFYTNDPLSMLHICNLHLYDQEVKVERKALETYINKHYLTHNGRYCMSMYQKFAVIRKN